MASVIFRLPITRTISLCSGALNACDSSINTVLQSLEQPRHLDSDTDSRHEGGEEDGIGGRSVVLIPGGISEMLLQSRARSRAGIVPVIKRRGFIRAALRHGAPVVPCFGFGVNEMYELFLWRDWVQFREFTGMFPMLLWGHYSVPFPKPTPVRLVPTLPTYGCVYN